jgi:hypothetical protein
MVTMVAPGTIVEATGRLNSLHACLALCRLRSGVILLRRLSARWLRRQRDHNTADDFADHLGFDQRCSALFDSLKPLKTAVHESRSETCAS